MLKLDKVKLVDCPRDAVQGIDTFIPTEKKIAYINQLIASRLFEYLDVGSFVSPKAVPQMRDTAEVIASLEKNAHSKLIAIIANEKGAELGQACPEIDYLGYPFSISDTFQKRNTNRTVDEAFETVKNCQEIIGRGNKQELMIYISMAFGNPYGDKWHPDIVVDWIARLSALGVTKFSIADTTSEATPEQITEVFNLVRDNFSELELSIHLHSRAETASSKIEAAFDAGCRIFEGALMGYGGCPFAKDDLVGNIPTEMLIQRFKEAEAHKIPDLLTGFQEMISN